MRVYARTFCRGACYHAWDSAHKQTESQQEFYRARAIRMLENGKWGSPSKLEDSVAEWLSDQDIAFDRQARLGRFWTADFKTGDVFIEIHGCYWHGCPDHFPDPTERQRQRMRADRGRETYCRRRGIPLIVVWEHDIRQDIDAALAPLIAAGQGDHLD